MNEMFPTSRMCVRCVRFFQLVIGSLIVITTVFWKNRPYTEHTKGAQTGTGKRTCHVAFLSFPCG